MVCALGYRVGFVYGVYFGFRVGGGVAADLSLLWMLGCMVCSDLCAFVGVIIDGFVYT